jgi:hypothetical protein
MRLAILAASAALCLLFTTSTASFAKPQAEYIPCGNYLHLCAKNWQYEFKGKKRATKHRSSFRDSDRRAVRKAQARSHRHARVARAAPTVRRGATEARQPHQQAARLKGVIAPLAAKAAEIVSTCGSRVVSAVRHTFIAGTRQISLHASGRAVDMVGNPGCMYALLKGWPGGYSTDYGRVRHVHISYKPGGREWGTRFVHGTRHARRHRMARIGG